jgi:hypothetical protein
MSGSGGLSAAVFSFRGRLPPCGVDLFGLGRFGRLNALIDDGNLAGG